MTDALTTNPAATAATAPKAPLAKVFISYSQRDSQAFADRLKVALGTRGVEAFVDRHDIEKNDEWRKALNDAIDGAHAFVFVISRGSVASRECDKELQRAERARKHIIAVRMDDVDYDAIPTRLREFQHIDFRVESTFDKNVGHVDAAIRTDFTWKRKAIEFSGEAARWEERGSSKALLLRPPRLEEAEVWLTARPPFMSESNEARRFVESSRAAEIERRRRRFLAIIASGVVAILVAAGMLFQYQSREFEARRANANFRAATDITNNVIRKIFPVLRSKRGVDQKTILSVLNASETIIDELVADLDNSPQVRELRMQVDNEFQLTYWFIGDVANSTKYVEAALRLNTDLLALFEKRGDTEGRTKYLELLQLRTNLFEDLGNNRHVVGRLADFAAALNTAKDTAESIVQLTGANDVGEQLRLSQTVGRIGDSFRKSGRFADAARQYARSEQLQRHVLADHPDDLKAQDALAWSDNRFGDNALRIFQHEGFLPLDSNLKPRFAATAEGRTALDRYADGYDIRKKLYDRDHSDKERRANFAWSSSLYGMALIAFDVDKAIAVLDDAAQLAHEMAAAEADDTQTKRYSALIAMFRGDAYLARGDLRSAFADYEKSQTLREALVAADDKNNRWRMDLIFLHEHLSAVYGYLGNRGKARDYAAKGLALLPSVLKAFPGDENLAATGNLLAAQAK